MSNDLATDTVYGQARVLAKANATGFSTKNQALDDITRLAAAICGTPTALVSLADGECLWFKSRVGQETRGIRIKSSFCAVAMALAKDLLVVEDTTKDPRFVTHALVTGPLQIRFYAGVPLRNRSGLAMGSLCVLDREPRKLSSDQTEALQYFARQVMRILERSRYKTRPGIGTV